MRNMRKVLLAFSVAFCCCSASWANVAFSTVDASYTSGAMGTIMVSGDSITAAAAVANLTSDTVLFSFADNGKTRVLATDRTNSEGDAVSIYDPQNWSAPLFNEVWSGANNVHGIAVADGTVYAACYNGGKIVKASTSDFKLTGEAYTCTSALASADVGAEKVIVNGDNVYALFSIKSGTYPNYVYQSSRLVKLDKELNAIASIDVGSNAVDMLLSNGSIYVAYWGGPQAYGVSGGIDRYDIAAGTVEHVLDGSTLGTGGNGMGVIDLGVVGSNLYFIAQSYDSATAYTTTSQLYRLNGSVATLVRDLTSSSGYSFAMLWDSENSLLWVMKGNDIIALDSSMTLKKTLLSIELQGNAYSMAFIPASKTAPVVPSPDPVPDDDDNDGGDGGGCSSLGLSMVFLLLPALLRRGKK